MGEDAAVYRERRFTAQDGLSLYYRDHGDALSPHTPVVCLAGLTRNSRDFEVLAPRLARKRRVLCLDYRGRGRSDHDPDWRRYTPAVYSGDVSDLLSAAGLHRVVVVGTSLGGLVAMMLAVARPTALAGVVLNDIGPDIDAAGLARIAAYVRAHAQQADWPSAVAFLRKSVVNRYLASDEDWLRIARRTWREEADGRLRSDFDPAIAKAFGRAPDAGPDSWRLFGALRRVPALAIRGGESDILSAATVERMAGVKPDLARITVAGVGHAPLLEEPECLSAIDDFLADV
ncbi:MAG: alpha/beta fold hydrolase [Alphaproteobacteria bacterium]